MRTTEGIRKAAPSLMLLAAALTLSQPLHAQHMITNLPRLTESGDNPVSFMRPHYSINRSDSERAVRPADFGVYSGAGAPRLWV